MKSELRLQGNRLFIRTPYSPALVDRFRLMPGREFHGDTKEWSVPAVKDVVLMVCDALGVLPWMLDKDIKELAGLDGRQAFNRVALDESVVNEHVFLTEPYAHQRTNLARLVQNKRWLLADEMGTGKTHAVVNRMRQLYLGQQTGPTQQVLIVCPKSVIATWRDELKKHAQLNGDLTLTIANYEQLLSNKNEFQGGTWKTVVFDEIHRLKNFTAKTSRVARKLSEKAQYVYGLSGTPAPNGLEDWFGVLSAIDPNLLPVKTKAAFNARYCVMGQITKRDAQGNEVKTGIWRVIGYRNVAELHDYIASVTSRVTKAECLDLPEKVFSTRKVTLEGEQARVYRELKKDAVARLKPLWDRVTGQMDIAQSLALVKAATAEQAVRHMEETNTLTVNNVLTEFLRLLQVVGGFVPDDTGTLHELPDKAKVDALDELLQEVGDKQVVVWCAFKAEATFLTKHLDKLGMVSTLTGDTPADERTAAIEAFRKGDARFFIGTSAGGEGVNGLQVCDIEVFYSRNWNLKDYLQMQDRCHRIGTKRTVSIYNLVAQGTVDEKVSEALERKASLQEMLLRNPEELF